MRLGVNPLIVRDAGMTGRVTIQSFDWRTLKIAQAIAPEIPTACAR
jgi:glycerophosphoryl diester phosphodiesterase